MQTCILMVKIVFSIIQGWITTRVRVPCKTTLLWRCEKGVNISFTLLNLYVATWLSFPCKACSALLPCLWLDCIEFTFILGIFYFGVGGKVAYDKRRLKKQMLTRQPMAKGRSMTCSIESSTLALFSNVDSQGKEQFLWCITCFKHLGCWGLLYYFVCFHENLVSVGFYFLCWFIPSFSPRWIGGSFSNSRKFPGRFT